MASVEEDEKNEEDDEKNEGDDKQKEGVDEEAIKRAKQKEAREQLLRIRMAREEVRKNREMHKNDASEDDVDDDLVIDVKRAAF